MHLWGEWKSGVSCDGAAVRCPREWVGSPASGRLPHREPPPICRGRRGILMKVSVGLDLGAPNHLFLGLHKQAFSIVNIGYEVSNGKTIPTNWEQCVRTVFWRRLLFKNVHGRTDADHTQVRIYDVRGAIQNPDLHDTNKSSNHVRYGVIKNGEDINIVVLGFNVVWTCR
jgi:hypothetical protein